jgi:hypothetical protein
MLLRQFFPTQMFGYYDTVRYTLGMGDNYLQKAQEA